MTAQNRRKDGRTHTSIRFWYRMPWSRRWNSASTEDISVGGLSFVLPSGVCFKGLPIEVAVEVPAAAFRSRARVVNTRTDASGRKVGLSFSELPGHLRDKLRTYVDRFRLPDNAAARPVFSL